MSASERFAAAAEALVGSPFRLHGRDPTRGIDCMGLVASALAAIGRPARAPRDYALRRRDIGGLGPVASEAGLVETKGPVRTGDVLLLRCGPAQLHLAIAGMGGAIIHAHAGLGRVVRTPGPLAWPIERHWRLAP